MNLLLIVLQFDLSIDCLLEINSRYDGCTIPDNKIDICILREHKFVLISIFVHYVEQSNPSEHGIKMAV